MESKRSATSLIEVVIASATATIVVSLLLPVYAASAREAAHPASNVRRVALASLLYAEEHNQRLPLLINGPMIDMVNTRDGMLTSGGRIRADGWPLVLLPYVRDRQAFVDPVRTDLAGIWRGPALATQDAAYDALKNTYRGQSRHPMIGVNYMFLSPLRIPADKMTDSSPTNWASGASRAIWQAEDAPGTVFYMDSRRFDLDNERGHWAVNAPGMWPNLSEDSSEYISFWGGTPCSGDWCGDADTTTPGAQRETSASHFDRTRHATVAFLDGSVAYMSDVALAAGTNFLDAKPNDGAAGGGTMGGGAVITDKSKYLWNLDDNYYEGLASGPLSGDRNPQSLKGD